MTYTFADCEVDAVRRELRRGGKVIHVEPQVLDVLLYLIKNRERVVNKTELLNAVWGGRIVSDAALDSRISAVRRAIGDSGRAQMFLQTVTRRGFRFICDVQEHIETGGPIARDEMTDKHRPSEGPIRAARSDRPSIAVLAFANLSSDPSQEYFSDGITDDIITELSRFSDLLVISRNSSFQYKARAVDVRQVGRELGVRYLLEGGIRRDGDRVRITAQLVDAETGVHRWAARYDRTLEDVFALQDEISYALVSILAAHINKAEAERTLLKPPALWEAYDYSLRADQSWKTFEVSYDLNELYEARRLCERSIAIDPSYARPYVTLSDTHFNTWINCLDGDYSAPAALDRAYELARSAVNFDPNLPSAHAQLGMAALFKRRHDEAMAEFERALAICPNYRDWRFSAVLVYSGDAERALDVVGDSMRVDPFPAPMAYGFLGFANFVLRRYEAAIRPLCEACARAPKSRPLRQWLAASYAQAGRLEEAHVEAAEVLRIQPSYTVNGTARYFHAFRESDDAEHLFASLQKAGLPE